MIPAMTAATSPQLWELGRIERTSSARSRKGFLHAHRAIKENGHSPKAGEKTKKRCGDKTQAEKA